MRSKKWKELENKLHVVLQSYRLVARGLVYRVSLGLSPLTKHQTVFMWSQVGNVPPPVCFPAFPTSLSFFSWSNCPTMAHSHPINGSLWPYFGLWFLGKNLPKTQGYPSKINTYLWSSLGFFLGHFSKDTFFWGDITHSHDVNHQLPSDSQTSNYIQGFSSELQRHKQFFPGYLSVEGSQESQLNTP